MNHIIATAQSTERKEDKQRRFIPTLGHTGHSPPARPPKRPPARLCGIFHLQQVLLGLLISQVQSPPTLLFITSPSSMCMGLLYVHASTTAPRPGLQQPCYLWASPSRDPCLPSIRVWSSSPPVKAERELSCSLSA